MESVLNQTNEGWELFIVDDQSEDDAWNVAEELACGDNRIVALRNSTNVGLAANFRRCGKQGTAPYLLLMAADDVLQENFLQEIFEVVKRQADGGLICGKRVLFYGQSGRHRPYRMPLVGRYEAGTTVARALANGNLYGLYSAVVMRRAALNAIGGIRADNPWAGDFEGFVRIAARFPVVFVPEASVYQHVDASTQTTQFLRNGQLVDYEALTLERLLADPDVRRALSTTDISAAWNRILALSWIIRIYSWRFRGMHKGLWDQKIPRQEGRRGLVVIKTMLRLVYQRLRLTY